MARIVIVGGGVAGLGAGIYSRMAGHDVVICERHFLAGGNLTGWSRGGYHIDNCIHWLTGTNENSSLYRMWCELGALGEGAGIVQESSLFSCERRGVRVSLPPSLSELRDNIILATQWQQSPGGLPIAASSGKWAAERIIKLENRK